MLSIVCGLSDAQPQPFPKDASRVEAFLDGAIEPAMADQKIAGATVAIVKDGQLFLSKGYGYADVAARTPVDPATTMFRVGSISKVFTWLMVMKQIEQGKLDLDADVNQYLTNFKVPEAFDEPIRLRHLMTHTPGFEDRVIGLFSRNADDMKPIAEILAKDLPARMWAPGAIPSYSNHGTALAGLIAANVSGRSWEDFAENQIMRPIGMVYATPLQPVPADLAPHLAKGYRYENGAYVDKGFEFVPLGSAGGVSASAEDMAKLMLMLLNGGEWNGHRVLARATLGQMKQQLHTLDPRVTGMAHGFIESKIGDLRLVGHGGDTFWFHSMLLLDDTHKLGFFMSTNSAEAGPLATKTAFAFFEHYFPPAPPEPVAPPEGALDRARRIAGVYTLNRYDYTGPAKIGALMNAQTVTASDDGALVLTGLGGEKPERWIETEPGYFRKEFNHDVMAVKSDASGQVQYMTVPNFAVFVLKPLHGIASPKGTIALLVFCFATFLITPVAYTWRAIVRIRRAEVGQRYRGFARISKLIGAGMCLWILAGVAVSGDMSDPLEIVFGLPPGFILMRQMNAVAGIIAAVVTLLSLFAWSRGYWSIPGRIYYSIVAAAGLAFFYWAWYWNFVSL